MLEEGQVCHHISLSDEHATCDPRELCLENNVNRMRRPSQSPDQPGMPGVIGQLRNAVNVDVSGTYLQDLGQLL